MFSHKALLRMLLVLIQFRSSKGLTTRIRLKINGRIFINNSFQYQIINSNIWKRCSSNNNNNIFLVFLNKKSIWTLSSKLLSTFKPSKNNLFRTRNYQLKSLKNQLNRQLKKNYILRIAKRTRKQQHINILIQLKLSTRLIC